MKVKEFKEILNGIDDNAEVRLIYQGSEYGFDIDLKKRYSYKNDVGFEDTELLFVLDSTC